jgi:hypothetical protein
MCGLIFFLNFTPSSEFIHFFYLLLLWGWTFYLEFQATTSN